MPEVHARAYEIKQGKVKISVQAECNLRCRYCSKEGTIGARCRRSISSSDILALGEALRSKGYTHAYLGGGGYGEPLENLERSASHVEIIKRDSKKKYHLRDLTVTVRLSKAFTGYALREDSPILRPDGKLVWLSHDNVIFDVREFKRRHSIQAKTELAKAISLAVDNRLQGVSSEILRTIASCGSFSRASW